MCLIVWAMGGLGLCHCCRDWSSSGRGTPVGSCCSQSRTCSVSVSFPMSQCLLGFSVQNNIGLVLHGVMEYDLSLRFLENALAISSKYHGSKSLKVALR